MISKPILDWLRSESQQEREFARVREMTTAVNAALAEQRERLTSSLVTHGDAVILGEKPERPYYRVGLSIGFNAQHLYPDIYGFGPHDFHRPYAEFRVRQQVCNVPDAGGVTQVVWWTWELDSVQR